MAIHYANSYRTEHGQSSIKTLFRRLLTDILPTLLILLLMACAMLLVARYIEAPHFKPLVSNAQVLHLSPEL